MVLPSFGTFLLWSFPTLFYSGILLFFDTSLLDASLRRYFSTQVLHYSGISLLLYFSTMVLLYFGTYLLWYFPTLVLYLSTPRPVLVLHPPVPGVHNLQYTSPIQISEWRGVIKDVFVDVFTAQCTICCPLDRTVKRPPGILMRYSYPMDPRPQFLNGGPCSGRRVPHK